MPPIHRRTHPEPVEGCYACKIASIGLRPVDPGIKQTVDHTDTAAVTTSEHFKVDRADVHVKLNDAVHISRDNPTGQKET